MFQFKPDCLEIVERGFVSVTLSDVDCADDGDDEGDRELDCGITEDDEGAILLGHALIRAHGRSFVRLLTWSRRVVL